MPSRLRTASDPSRPISIADAGETTESMGAATIGFSNLNASNCHAVETRSGSRVRRLGAIAMSSNPYAGRPRLPRPISISLNCILLTLLVVRSFDRHLNVVGMTLLQARRGYPDELAAL